MVRNTFSKYSKIWLLSHGSNPERNYKPSQHFQHHCWSGLSYTDDQAQRMVKARLLELLWSSLIKALWGSVGWVLPGAGEELWLRKTELWNVFYITRVPSNTWSGWKDWMGLWWETNGLMLNGFCIWEYHLQEVFICFWEQCPLPDTADVKWCNIVE